MSKSSHVSFRLRRRSKHPMHKRCFHGIGANALFRLVPGQAFSQTARFVTYHSPHMLRGQSAQMLKAIRCDGDTNSVPNRVPLLSRLMISEVTEFISASVAQRPLPLLAACARLHRGLEFERQLLELHV